VYWAVFPYVLGVLLAWITWYPARKLEVASEQWYFRVIMTIVAVGFIGFPLEHGNVEAAVLELVVLVILLCLIILSRRAALTALLPLAWFGHGLWDLVYLLDLLPLDKPEWVVQLCVPYDWLIAAYLFSRASSWRDVAH
jgi:hypothetical protein